ncbi:DNA-directed RNA polymerase III subunit RPC4 [Anthonomus grandis grandis]|uniref:DNA-directed RNA polymerase III subunit RPC4 n=1 Tax=Anthonomus grandis grandis TaxID=2921223 RepID=UPI002165A66F|nr:DNA-directed RNA polymerase III subunit RPC4 [Anthonomus grandis grandis]
MENRLKSLKHRDLTLGGSKPKKIFMPNLNVTRNKDKNGINIKSEFKPKLNNRRDLKNNKKVFDKAERFVQSSGIFSDGMGGEALKRARFESPREDTGSASMPVPKVKKDEWKVDSKKETKAYDDIMKYHDSSIEDDDITTFNPISWNEADLKESKAFIKPEVKSEPGVEMSKLKIKDTTIPEEFQHTELYSDYNPALMLWKVPDSFAAKGLSDDPNDQKCFDYKLSDMLEGQIGKMRIHKSGKIDVYLGSVRYDIEPADLESFLEKIVAIDVKGPQNASSLVLGQVQKRFILNPDWTNLIE